MPISTLADLGWSAHFARQIAADDTPTHGTPARISEVHRDRVTALSTTGAMTLRCDDTGAIAVGDWVVCDGTRVMRILGRETLVRRRAAGPMSAEQLIAANVGTLGIVTSCNADFSEARLERYLALALDAGAMPLVVLTKSDLSDVADQLRRRAERLSPLVSAIALNATDPDEADRLAPWCRDGRTLALVGSSGVGKTTLQNVLTGLADTTAAIREDDARGRHTTTARALRPTRFGGWLIDTPGMRELGLSEAAAAIDEVFADITDLARQCRFADCGHAGEPGCAIGAAVASGHLDQGRLERWLKLRREDRHASQTLAERRQRDRSRSRLYEGGRARGAMKRRNWDDDRGPG